MVGAANKISNNLDIIGFMILDTNQNWHLRNLLGHNSEHCYSP